jgi:hypothetical protein
MDLDGIREYQSAVVELMIFTTTVKILPVRTDSMWRKYPYFRVHQTKLCIFFSYLILLVHGLYGALLYMCKVELW